MRQLLRRTKTACFLCLCIPQSRGWIGYCVAAWLVLHNKIAYLDYSHKRIRDTIGKGKQRGEEQVKRWANEG